MTPVDYSARAPSSKAFALHRAVAMGTRGQAQLAEIVGMVDHDFAALDEVYNDFRPTTKTKVLPDIRPTWAGVAASAMIAAVEANDLEFLRTLWRSQMIVDPGSFYPNAGGSVLNAAIHCRNVGAIQEMLAAGAEVSDFAMLHCIESVDLHYIRNVYGLVPAKPSAWRDVFDVLAPHCDLNLAEPEFARPLHWAASLGEIGIVRALLEGGANPLLRSGDNLLPRELVPSGSKWRGLRDTLDAAEREAKCDPRMLSQSLEEVPGFVDPADRIYLFDRVSHASWMLDVIDCGQEIELFVDRQGKAIVVNCTKVFEIAEAEGVSSFHDGRVPARFEAITREHSFDLKLSRSLSDRIWRGSMICALDWTTPEIVERDTAIDDELERLVQKKLPNLLEPEEA